MDYPYEKQLYAGALDVVAALRKLAPTVALTDGDAVFQPRKLQRSGLAAALDHQVMICVHKELELAEIERRFPARHYVVVDDKVRILTAFRQAWGTRVTTVFPRQGQFGLDAKVLAANPTPDITVERIADLLDPSMLDRLRATKAAAQ